MTAVKGWIKERRTKVDVVPDSKSVFKAFHLCPYEETKIVILGQDPYPTPGHAHGLAFSSLGREIPDSLQNIFEELKSDLYSEYPNRDELFRSADLTRWAEQGVLLLNTILTTEAGERLAHKNVGWEFFTQKIIQYLGREYEKPLVFMLWGKEAGTYAQYIDNKHLVLTAAHPSPLSAKKGFFGCKHFSQAIEFLVEKGRLSIVHYNFGKELKDSLKEAYQEFLEKHKIVLTETNLNGQVQMMKNAMFTVANSIDFTTTKI